MDRATQTNSAKHLRGTIDTAFNNGTSVSGRVTLGARDALILVDTKSLP